MMASIKLDIDQAKQVSNTFRSLSSQVSNLTAQLNSSIQNLPSFWEGASSKRLLSDFETWKKKMQTLSNNLTGIASEIDKIAKALADADKKLSAR
jgi:WXG100 family type VII secretion target